MLIARINLLNTFCDYLKSVWNKKATKAQLKKVAEIISWNIWQMDGLKGTIPFKEIKEEETQINFFDFLAVNETNEEDDIPTECVIKDWEEDEIIKYNDLKRG